jgi:nucleoside-diphosphate-sugar epimerase
MRIFVTGATGFVGSAVVEELLGAGHTVVGLARSEASARSLIDVGAEVQQGGLDDLDSLRKGVAIADAVIHTAFIHDFSKFKENCEIDRRAIEAMGSALMGSRRRLIVTSGSALVASNQIATEASRPTSTVNPRVASEQAAASLATRGVQVSIMRLPPSVHGDGDHGFVPHLIELARDKGVAAYVGDGLNRWPAVHRFDAARLYRLAIESSAAEAHYHAIAEEGIAFREIAAIIGRRLSVPAISVSREEAANHFAWFTHFATLDNPVSSARTRELLAWQPARPGLLADLDRSAYFGVKTATQQRF